MSRRERFGRGVLTALTYVFVLFVHRTLVRGVREIDLLDEPTTVYMVKKDGPMFAQSVLFLGTILINEPRWDEMSEVSKRFVLRHELSHSNRNPVFQGIFIGLLISMAAAVKNLVMVGIWIATGRVATVNPLPVLIIVSVIVLFIGVARIEETIADQQAIEALGEEDFRTAYEELLDGGPDSLGGRVLRSVMYTEPENSVRLYHFRKKVAASVESALRG